MNYVMKYVVLFEFQIVDLSDRECDLSQVVGSCKTNEHACAAVWCPVAYKICYTFYVFWSNYGD
jgi:hypothetical protein